jgi:hypothetical protein
MTQMPPTRLQSWFCRLAVHVLDRNKAPDESSSKYKLDLGSTYPTCLQRWREQIWSPSPYLVDDILNIYMKRRQNKLGRKLKIIRPRTQEKVCRAISLSDWPIQLDTSYTSNVYWFLLKTYAMLYIPTKQDFFLKKKVIINNSANCVPLQRMDQESSYQSMLAWSARGEIGTKGRGLQLGTRRCRSSVKRAGRRLAAPAIDDQ